MVKITKNGSKWSKMVKNGQNGRFAINKFFRGPICRDKTRQDIFRVNQWLLDEKYNHTLQSTTGVAQLDQDFLPATPNPCFTMLGTDRTGYWKEYFIQFCISMSGYFVLMSQQNNGTKSNSRQKHQLIRQIFSYREGQEKANYHNVRILY